MVARNFLRRTLSCAAGGGRDTNDEIQGAEMSEMTSGRSEGGRFAPGNGGGPASPAEGSRDGQPARAVPACPASIGDSPGRQAKPLTLPDGRTRPEGQSKPAGATPRYQTGQTAGAREAALPSPGLRFNPFRYRPARPVQLLAGLRRQLAHRVRLLQEPHLALAQA